MVKYFSLPRAQCDNNNAKSKIVYDFIKSFARRVLTIDNNYLLHTYIYRHQKNAIFKRLRVIETVI